MAHRPMATIRGAAGRARPGGDRRRGVPAAAADGAAARVRLRRGDRGAGRAGGRRPGARARRRRRATASPPAQSIARLDTTDTELAIRRVEAEREPGRRAAAAAAGRRAPRRHPPGARAGRVGARPTSRAAESELRAAADDLARFEALLASNAGSRKQRDDAATRRDVAAARVAGGARTRRAPPNEAVAGCAPARGARRSPRAQARVDAVDAQIAALAKSRRRRDADVAGRRHRHRGWSMPGEIDRAAGAARRHHRSRSRLGERLRRRAARAAADARPDDPLVTDAGQRLEGTITFISPKAEFTPRNVQTAEERSKLVYRIKVTVDNREGVLKPGMPVEAELPR